MQLIEKRRDLGGRRSGDDGLGEHFEGLQLVRVEELGLVGGDGRLFLRLLDAGGTGQVVLHRVLRLDQRRQCKPSAHAAQQRLQHRATRDAVGRGRVSWCDGDDFREIGTLAHEPSLARRGLANYELRVTNSEYEISQIPSTLSAVLCVILYSLTRSS